MKERNEFTFPITVKVNNNIKSPKNYDVGDLIKVVCNKIYNINDVTVNIFRNDNILKKLSTKDLEIEAFTEKTPLSHTYNIFLSSNLSDSLEIIICHELCHLYQFERGDLELDRTDGNLNYSWKGTKIDPHSDYWTRPWEIEARKQSTKLWKQFKELYYK